MILFCLKFDGPLCPNQKHLVSRERRSDGWTPRTDSDFGAQQKRGAILIIAALDLPTHCFD